MKVSPIHSGTIEVYTDAGLDSLSWVPTSYPAETNMFETGDTLYFQAFEPPGWKFLYWTEGLEEYRSHLMGNPLVRTNDMNYLFYANFEQDDSYEPEPDLCADCPCDCPDGGDCPECDKCPDPVECDSCCPESEDCPDLIICPEPIVCPEPEKCEDCPDCILEDSGCFINVLL